MTAEKFKEILSDINLPFAYKKFKSPQKAPYLVFSYSDKSDFYADGKIYFTRAKWRVDLYTDIKDEDTEEKVENVLKQHFSFTKTEEYIESLKIFQIIYEMEG